MQNFISVRITTFARYFLIFIYGRNFCSFGSGNYCIRSVFIIRNTVAWRIFNGFAVRNFYGNVFKTAKNTPYFIISHSQNFYFIIRRKLVTIWNFPVICFFDIFFHSFWWFLFASIYILHFRCILPTFRHPK